MYLSKIQISFLFKKKLDLHLRKIHIHFFFFLNSDLHLRKMQIFFFFFSYVALEQFYFIFLYICFPSKDKDFTPNSI